VPDETRLAQISGRVAVAALVVGVGLLVFADAPALHAIGVAALIAFVIAGFLWLGPALLPDLPARSSGGGD
jgi:hypothetical protein